MIPPSFEYLRPKTIPEAIAFLQQYGEDAKILSGGQSLIPMMKLRLARPGYLVDINRIAGLSHIKEEGGYLKLGGLTREAELEVSPVVRSKYPLIIDTAHAIADPQVRNLATVGGNLAHGDPANDHPATMIALGAQIVATGPRGERVIPIEDFFLSLFSTALRHDEILTEIRIPIPPPRSGGAYFKLERKVGDFATAAVAVQLTLDDNGACQRVGIGLTNVGPTPVKARKAEDYLRGKKIDEASIKQAGQLASDEAEPSGDLRGPAEYKKGLVKELAKRALTRALERARK
ncbi:MAG TPA: xanthine dehydrogenase family protein subunit M [Candidatus Sulfotelmatobacter sp.]|jgi:carbon-monoxide dehydrogenase medium subunit|nr:xanthine dehydrogenase family protein subunit M [Candidatus Sulfotelmatobacter sp.]